MPKSRAALDTNLLYYAVGYSDEVRLREDWLESLTETYDLALPSPAIVEVLTNGSLKGGEIWTCIDAMVSGCFKEVVQIGYLPFDPTSLAELHDSRDHAELERVRNEALTRKIACEAEFLRFTSYALIGGFMHVVFDERAKGLSPEQRVELVRHFDAMTNGNQQLTLTALAEGLRTGYAEGRPDKASDRVLQRLLQSFAAVALTSLHSVIGGGGYPLPRPAPSDRDFVRALTAAFDDPLYKQIAKGEHPFQLLRKPKYARSVETYLDEMIEDFEREHLMPVNAVRAFIAQLTRAARDGAKFRKNDVLDLLMVFSTVADDTLLATNDDGLLALLEKASPESHKLSLSLRR